MGSVKDGAGAAVAGARLTVRNLDEDTAGTSVTGPQGLYQFVSLKPGRYEVTAEHAGFRPVRTPEIVLNARQSRRADFTLEIAARTDTVLVTASVPRINTENGTVADTKTFEQVTRLPINSRGLSSNPFTAILTVPGVQADAAGRVSIGGGLPLQIEYSVDGISTINILTHSNADGLGPSPEMLQEFRVTSVDGGAALGPMGDVTIVSRGGTNQVHGSLLWYHQNRALDAKTWGAPQKQQKIANEFGASLGGPVNIPGLYSGRNRTFFFADVEGNRRPQSMLVQKAYPPAAARGGDLNTSAGGRAVDPFTGAPFPSNRIPAARINPVATLLLKNYYPLPNFTAPGAVNNFLDLVNTAASANGYDFRGDHIVSDR